MFNKAKIGEVEKKSKGTKDAQSTYTKIGEEVKIEGDINCLGDVRVDGNVLGNINTQARVIIGTKGKVLGNIQCDSAEIDGKFKGKIEASNLLSVTQNADIEGDVVTGRLSISDPKNFNVDSCKMQKSTTPINK